MKKLKAITCLLLLLNITIAFASNDPDKKITFEEITITKLHTAIQQKQLTCVAIINHYLDRIRSYNLNTSQRAPINAFTTINPNVLSQAKQLDEFYENTHQLLGPLHCVPVILKDNIDSYDSTSTAGSLALLGNQPNQDAFIVTQLRKAGAVIIGKGSMDELASGVFGISSRSGRVGNAYDGDKNPGGSSGGPAAAVSANFAVIGIGTDNSGSVRIPAAFNGIFGLRPSTGLISQHGIFPGGNLDGTAGPLTRTVEDLAIVLDVIAKQDNQDEQTSSVPRVSTYTIFLNKNGLQGKRIGIVRQVGKVDTFKSVPIEIQQFFNQAYDMMRQAGAVIIDDIHLPQFDNDRKANMAGTREDVDNYLLAFPAVRKNFTDICESDRTRVYGNVQQCVKFIKSLPSKFSVSYKKALSTFHSNKLYVEKIMTEHQLDALLLPISRLGEATYDADEINTWLAPIASNAGLPAITINLGYTKSSGLPVGVELIGKQFAEGNLIEIAYAYEQSSSPRIAPLLSNPSYDLQQVDISAYNNLLTEIGYRSYMEVLQKKQSNKLSDSIKILKPEIFKDIVKRVIRVRAYNE